MPHPTGIAYGKGAGGFNGGISPSATIKGSNFQVPIGAFDRSLLAQLPQDIDKVTKILEFALLLHIVL